MKKASNKVVLAQPAATAPRLLPRAPGPVRGAAAGGGGESYRARLRYQSLLQDYKGLLKETAAKKNRLHMEKLRKQCLLAEVKFLRRRYKSMSENPSQTVVYKVKNPAMGGPASRTTVWDGRQRSVQAVGSSSKALPTQRTEIQCLALARVNSDMPCSLFRPLDRELMDRMKVNSAQLQHRQQYPCYSAMLQRIYYSACATVFYLVCPFSIRRSRQQGTALFTRALPTARHWISVPTQQQQQRQHSAPRTSPFIDLNEACESSFEEMEEFHGYQQSVAAGPSDLKTPAAFWDVRNSAVRAGKRKISWQLALRV